MTPAVGIPDEHRASVVTILNDLLSDESLLYTKTRNYHRNVVGRQFNDLHKFFEAQSGELNDVADDVAERARALGGPRPRPARRVRTARAADGAPRPAPDAVGMVADLLDHETVIRQLRTDVAVERHPDMGTSDFRTGLMERHEEMAWMLRAFLSAS